VVDFIISRSGKNGKGANEKRKRKALPGARLFRLLITSAARYLLTVSASIPLLELQRGDSITLPEQGGELGGGGKSTTVRDLRTVQIAAYE